MTPQQIAAYEAPPIMPPGQSLTITTLPSNANIRLMQPSEISALAPPRPNRPESLVFRPMTSHRSGTRITYKFTVRGIPADGQFTHWIVKQLKFLTEGEVCGCSSFKRESKKDGSTEISFKANDLSLSERVAQSSYIGVSNLFRNLFDLGVSVHDIGLSCEDAICADLSWNSWHCERSEDSITRRAGLIGLILNTGYFDLAFPLICDLRKACNETGLHHLASARLCPPGALKLIRHAYQITSKEFTELIFETLEESPQLLTRRHSLAQAGRMLLRSMTDPAFQSEFHDQFRRKVFAAIGDFRKRCSKAEAEALLQDLLDMPSDDRGELLLDPRVRQLMLMGFPDLRDLFETIDGNAYEVFLDRRKTLEDCGIVFSGNFGQPVEINGAYFDSDAVYNLLDLAEAAVLCAGKIDCATGVLLFLSERVLDVDELTPEVLERAEALRDRIQLTVKSEMADQFDAIKALTDEAIAELRVWYGTDNRCTHSRSTGTLR